MIGTTARPHLQDRTQDDAKTVEGSGSVANKSIWVGFAREGARENQPGRAPELRGVPGNSTWERAREKINLGGRPGVTWERAREKINLGGRPGVEFPGKSTWEGAREKINLGGRPGVPV
jgi:hypothetical protein